MSTRSNIIVTGRGDDCILYRHYDGYPSGVGFDLESIFFKKNSESFVDNEECATYIHTMDDLFEYDDAIAGDIEFLYTINIKKGTIECRSCTSRRIIYNAKFGEKTDFNSLNEN